MIAGLDYIFCMPVLVDNVSGDVETFVCTYG